MAPYLRESEAGVILEIYAQPRASKNEISGLQGGELKLRLTSPPVEGAANKLCREFLAKFFGVAKSEVALVSGEKSRHKRLLIRGATAEGVRRIVEARLGSLEVS